MSVDNYNNYPQSVIQEAYKRKTPLRCANGSIIHYEGSGGRAFPVLRVKPANGFYFGARETKIKTIALDQMPRGTDIS